MAKNSIVASSKPFLITLAILAAAFLFSAGLKIILWDPLRRTLVTGALVCGFILLLVSRKSLSQFLARLPRPHAVIFAVFLFLFVTGQLLAKSRVTFPFSSWAMFTGTIRDETVQYHQYLGYTAKGNQILIRPGHGLRVVRDGRFLNRLEQLAWGLTLPPEKRASESETGPSADIPPHRKVTDAVRALLEDPMAVRARYDPEELEGMFAAFASIYNARRPHDPIQEVEIVRVTEYFMEPYPFRLEKNPVYRFRLKGEE